MSSCTLFPVELSVWGGSEGGHQSSSKWACAQSVVRCLHWSLRFLGTGLGHKDNLPTATHVRSLACQPRPLAQRWSSGVQPGFPFYSVKPLTPNSKYGKLKGWWELLHDTMLHTLTGEDTMCGDLLTDPGDADWLSRVTSVQSSTTCGTDWCHCLSVQENSGMLGEAWLPSTGPDWKLSAGDVGSYLILSSLEFAVLARLTLNPQGSTSLSQVVELKIMPRYQLTFWDKVSLKLDFIGLSRPSVGQLPNNLQFVTHCGLWDLASTGFKF